MRPCPRTITAISDHGTTVQQVRRSQLCGDQRSLVRGRPQETDIRAPALPDVLELAVGSSADRADAPGHPVGHRTQRLRLPV